MLGIPNFPTEQRFEVTLPRSTWWVVNAKSGSCAPVLFMGYVQSSMSRGAPNELVLHRSI